MKKLILILAVLSNGCYATIHKPMKEVRCYQVIWKQGAVPDSQFAVCENIDGEQIQVVIFNPTK